MSDIRIDLKASTSLERTNEPVTCGVPFPKGLLFDDQTLGMFDESGKQVPLQTSVLDKWPDGSARWVLCDWQASGRKYWLKAAASRRSELDSTPLDRLGDRAFRLMIETESEPMEVVWSVQTFESSGPLRGSVNLQGEHSGVACSARLHSFHGLNAVRFYVTLTNMNPAEHPGGLWDLGNGGSILFRQASIVFAANSDSCHISAKTGASILTGKSISLNQASSGGDHWNHPNHLNRDRVVPLAHQGYRLSIDQHQETGLRAAPIVTLGNQVLSLSMPSFWMNFPKSIEATNTGLTLGLFPRHSTDLHEIQGGEQKTHIFYVAFGRDTITTDPLAWTRDPLIPVVDREWVASTGAIPYLTPQSSDPHPGYRQLVDAAIEGDDTFEKKREVIDEFGWRHFGEIYGDHEAVFHQGPTPLVSHYNNQYDAVAGLLYQFLRSGDVRWRQLANDLASHVIDIDIYHTDRDKAAYNHGQFWHTFHYVDADTGTHRAYPKMGRVPPHGRPVPGGGPGNEQNYATGLMLHYFLTGDLASKEAAIGLAQWVIDMDDGNKTVFRWLSRGDTGLASQSRTPDYHGPGRGSANSISVLLDGHRLTGDRKFLNKAEQLVRRCIHPSDNVERRNLLDAENRWFYTMFLQSLGKFLDYKIELGQLDGCYAYARASLLHYARWMAEYEYPYLDKPEILEYPTETWAAQDMRKCEVFQFAAVHATGEGRRRFQERAAFFYHASIDMLLKMPTRTLCRPLVLMLSNGFSRGWHLQKPEVSAPTPDKVIVNFGEPERFVPQKTIALKRFQQLVVAGAGLCAFVALMLLIRVWG